MVDDFFTDPKLWIAAASLVVSVSSAIYSGRKASRALAISENQEQRRQPQFSIYLANGYRRRVPQRQMFAFLVTVSNPTDINNSIALAELQITYLLAREAKATCRIPHNPGLGAVMYEGEDRGTILPMPLRVDAHQSVSGWFIFAVDQDVIRGGTIDAHRLILEDTHGVVTTTEPIIVKEWTDEAPKG